MIRAEDVLARELASKTRGREEQDNMLTAVREGDNARLCTGGSAGDEPDSDRGEDQMH